MKKYGFDLLSHFREPYGPVEGTVWERENSIWYVLLLQKDGNSKDKAREMLRKGLLFMLQLSFVSVINI